MTTTHAQRRRRRLILGLSPAGTIFGIFLLIPLALVVVISFLEPGRYGGVVWSFETDAYKRLLFVPKLDGSVAYNTSFLIIFFRSIVLAVLTTAICIVIAFPTAYFISRRSARMKSILLLLIMFPFWSNLLIRTTSWIVILRDHGLVNQILLSLGLIDAPIRLLYTEASILIGLVYVYIPFMVLPIYTSVERLDRRLIEAAFDLSPVKSDGLSCRHRQRC